MSETVCVVLFWWMVVCLVASIGNALMMWWSEPSQPRGMMSDAMHACAMRGIGYVVCIALLYGAAR